MKKYNFLIILLLFLFIYEPPIISINVLHIIGALSWVYIFINNEAVSKIMKLNLIMKIYGVLFTFWMYLAIVAFVNENSILNSFSFIYWIFDIFPISIMLSVHFSKKNYNVFNLLNILLITGTIQGITAVLAFFSPNIKEFFIGKLISYGYSNRFFELAGFRMYGFASNLTYSTPIVQSVLAVISVYLAINKSTKYIFFTPLLLFSSIINARTSFIIFVIGIFSMVIASKKNNIKSIVRLAIIGVALIITINFGVSLIKAEASETYEWVVQGFKEIFQIFEDEPSQKEEGYFDYINNSERYVLPDGFGILFGVGERILSSNNYGVYSDVGYTNDIWLGGILYSFFIYIFFIFIIKNIGRIDNSNIRMGRFLYLLFIGTFIVSNIKGYIFVMNNLTNLLILIFTFVVLKKDRLP